MKTINGFEIPAWWSFLHRRGWPILANRLYEFRYGTSAPGLIDLVQAERIMPSAYEMWETIETDPSLQPGTIEVRQNGRVTGRIVNIDSEANQ